jgi:hypothetical protein
MFRTTAGSSFLHNGWGRGGSCLVIKTTKAWNWPLISTNFRDMKSMGRYLHALRMPLASSNNATVKNHTYMKCMHSITMPACLPEFDFYMYGVTIVWGQRPEITSYPELTWGGRSSVGFITVSAEPMGGKGMRSRTQQTDREIWTGP